MLDTEPSLEQGIQNTIKNTLEREKRSRRAASTAQPLTNIRNLI